MALDLGELVGSIGLDITPLERAVAVGEASIKSFAADGEATAKAAGDSIGVAMAAGLTSVPTEATQAAVGVKAAFDQIPGDTKAAADQAAAGVKSSLDQIPADAKAVVDDIAAAWGLGVDEIARLMDELPKNANGTVKETSAEFKQLPYELKGALLQVKAQAGQAFAAIPTEARQAGNEASAQLGAGLDGAKTEAEGAGERAGKAFADGLGRYVVDAGKVAGVAAGTALSVGVLDNLSLEQGRLKVVAQLGLTEQESARIGRIAGRVYAANFGESVEDVNVAIASVISSIRGMRQATGTEIGAATRVALAYGDVFEIDVPRAVSVAGTIIRSGLADNAIEAFDLMTQASSRVPAALREDVLDAAEEYGQFFSSLGYDGPAAFAMLVKGAEDGMYGIDKAGDAVKEFTIRSTDMSTATKDAYKTLGLNARTMADDILAGGGRAQKATQRVVDGLLAIESPSKRANTAIALFGTPLEDLSVRQIPQFLQSLRGGDAGMKGWEGSARQMADTAGGGTANSIETAKRKVLEWGRGVIESTGPTTVLAGAIAAFGPAVLGVIGPTAQLIAARAAQTAAAGTAAAAETAAHTATKAGWISSAATAMASAVRMAAAWVIAMGPIAIAIAAIAGIAYLIYKYWDEIKAYTVAVWDWIVDKVGAVPGLIASFFLNFTLVGLIIKHWDTIKSATGAAWDWVVDKVKAIPGLIVSFFLNWTIVGRIIKHWDDIKAGTQRAWDAVVDFVKAIPGRLLSFFLNWTLAGRVIKHWDDAKDGTIRVATSIVNWVAELPGKILGKLASLAGGLFDLATGAFSRLRDAAEARVTALLGYVAGIPGRVKSRLGNLGRTLYNAGLDLIQGLIDGIEDKASSLMGKLQSITNKIPDWKGPADKDKRLLTPTGRMIIQGLIDGITSKDRDLEAQLGKVTDLIEKTMQRRYKSDKVAEAAARAVIKGLQDERRELLANERERDRIDAKLDAARDRLRELRTEAREYARSIQDAIVAYGNITSFVDQETGTVTADAIIAGLRDKAFEAYEYTNTLEQLAAMGLSQDYIDQLTAAGVDGGLATARALLEGGQMAIDQVNLLNTSLNLSGRELGTSLAGTMYGSGIDAAEALVQGLEQKKDKLERQGRRLARAFIRGLRQEFRGLGIDLGIELPQARDTNGKDGPQPKGGGKAGEKATAPGLGGDRTDEVVDAIGRVATAVDRGTMATKTLPRDQLRFSRMGI